MGRLGFGGKPGTPGAAGSGGDGDGTMVEAAGVGGEGIGNGIGVGCCCVASGVGRDEVCGVRSSSGGAGVCALVTGSRMPAEGEGEEEGHALASVSVAPHCRSAKARKKSRPASPMTASTVATILPSQKHSARSATARRSQHAS